MIKVQADTNGLCIAQSPLGKGTGGAVAAFVAAAVQGQRPAIGSIADLAGGAVFTPSAWLVDRCAGAAEPLGLLLTIAEHPAARLLLLSAERPALRLLEQMLLSAASCCIDAASPVGARATLHLSRRDGWALPAAEAFGFRVWHAGAIPAHRWSTLQINDFLVSERLSEVA